jgi:hypothetical protein
MNKLTIILTVLFIGLTMQNIFAQTQKEKERATFISNAKLLEKKPFDPNAQVARESGFKWVADTDEVSVTLCSDIMKLIPEKKNKFKGELLMQFTFGVAVFKLENPDKKNDENAANLAGIESMLRTYQVMLKENEKAKNVDLDSLVVKQNNNELKAVVDAAKCKK